MAHFKLMVGLTLVASLGLSGGAGADCDPWPPGVQPVARSGQALVLAGDFNGDGLEDRLEWVQVAAGTQLPQGLVVANPWDRQPARAGRAALPVAFAIRHGTATGGPCRRWLLAHPNLLASPLWRSYLAGEENTPPLSLVRSGSKEHQAWRRRVKTLRGDGIVMGSEAGIDLLLYWTGSAYGVFWPPEEP